MQEDLGRSLGDDAADPFEMIGQPVDDGLQQSDKHTFAASRALVGIAGCATHVELEALGSQWRTVTSRLSVRMKVMGSISGLSLSALTISVAVMKAARPRT